MLNFSLNNLGKSKSMGKSKLVYLMLAAFTLIGLTATSIGALERRPIESIPIDELIKETMQMQTNGDSINMAWYFPIEALGAPPQPVVIIAVIKAKMDSSDVFTFASEVEAQKGLKVTYTNSNGISTDLVPAPKSADVSGFITEMKPFLSKFAGNLGAGMWLFAYQNVDSSGKNIVSPYEVGKLKISLGGEGDRQNSTLIEFPLNSLFVPRLCPNGKPAHVSWKYCPWDGTPLSNKLN